MYEIRQIGGDGIRIFSYPHGLDRLVQCMDTPIRQAYMRLGMSHGDRCEATYEASPGALVKVVFRYLDNGEARESMSLIPKHETSKDEINRLVQIARQEKGLN